MTDPLPSHPLYDPLSGRRRWPGPWTALSGALLAALLAYVAANVTGGRQLTEELARARAEGAPLTLTEAAPPAVPEAENAAPLYARAFSELPRLERTAAEGPESPARLASVDEKVLNDLLHDDPARREPVTLDALRQTLAGTETALALARRAAATRRCRFAVRWEDGARALLPHLPMCRSLARLLGGQAVLFAREGRSAEAMANLTAMVGIADHIGAEPTLIGQLVQYACLALMGNALRQVMESAPPAPELCWELDARLAGLDLYDRFHRALQSERCLGLWAFDAVRRDGRAAAALSMDHPEPLLGLLLLPRALREPALKWDQVVYLRLMARQIARAREPQPLAPDGGAEYDGPPPPYAPMTRLLLPALASAGAKRDLALARLALARVALALEICRIRQGQYPGSLSEAGRIFGRTLPEDPFTGTPLRYDRQEGGYLLYSIGSNRRDDGGKHRRPLAGGAAVAAGPSDDIAWDRDS